jgi:histidine triad (HIT) family protein
MGNCLFCDIQSGQTPSVGGPVYEDELVYAHHFYAEDRVNYLGHLIVETKRHTPDFTTLTPAEAQAVGLLIARLSGAIKTCTGAEKVYAEFYGEVTPHLHVHLMARYPETPEAYLRWNVTDWPDAPRANADDVAALCEQLRATLAPMLS